MKAAWLVTGWICAKLGAAEVSLYDCDYAASSALVGQPVPLSSAAMPGRTACADILFGEVVIGNATSPWSGTTRQLALRSVRITGDDYDGPLFVGPDAGVTENDVATVPFVPPASGTWQPQFSIDGQLWKNYAQTVDADFPFSSISFGKRVAPNMFFRLLRVVE